MNPQDEILALDWRVIFTFGEPSKMEFEEVYDCSLIRKEVIRDFGRDFPHATIKSVQRVEAV